MHGALPLPIVARSGSAVKLKASLDQIYGADVREFSYAYLGQQSRQTAIDYNFSFWKPGSPSVGDWRVSGASIGYSNYVYVDDADFGRISFRAGNVIWANASLSLTTSSGYQSFSVCVVDPAVARRGMTDGIVDPSDIVAAARRMNNFYGSVPNQNDCHNIATAVAAAAGAVFSSYTGNHVNPRLNEEYGFWRIAYRGTDGNATNDWSRVIRPGDIVRMAWDNGGPHTATIVSVNGDGSFQVYDNYNRSIGLRTVRYDEDTVRNSITIYRLTPDHLFLINGDGGVDELMGTLFMDELVGRGGADILRGGAKADLLIGGLGADRLIGGIGLDTASYETATKGVVASLKAPALNTNEARGDTYVSIENLKGSRFHDRLAGDDLANRIEGGAGNDRLDGERGRDVLVGGAGDDAFIFSANPGYAHADRITDFSVADDSILLDDDAFVAVGVVGDLKPVAFWIGAEAHDRSDRIIYDRATGALYYDADGAGGADQVLFARLNAGLNLRATDFDIIA